jgi:hypothetical protein
MVAVDAGYDIPFLSVKLSAVMGLTETIADARSGSC